MTTLRVLSDLHLAHQPFSLGSADADVLILAGNIDVGQKGLEWAITCPETTPVLYVLGNHEYFGNPCPAFADMLSRRASGTHVKVLENNMVRLKGINFFGATLWTDFNVMGSPHFARYECQRLLRDYRCILSATDLEPLTCDNTATMHAMTLHWLQTQLALHRGETNVVVTHHAPSKRSLPTFTTSVLGASSASRLDSIIDEFRPTAWIHGHVSEAVDYQLHHCQVVSNPRGFHPEIETGFNQSKLITV